MAQITIDYGNISGGSVTLVTVPILTSSDTRSFGSTEHSTTYYPYMVFDRVYNSNTDCFHGASGIIPAWVGYEFDEKVCVTKVSVRSRASSSAHNPKKFYIQGSDVGGDTLSNWENVSEELTFNSSSADYEQDYDLSNTQAFKYYRIYVTEAYDSYVVIGNLQFYGYSK